MKLLKVVAKGLPLFHQNLEIDFFADGRVYQEEKHELNHLFGNLYLNKTLSFTGINASGKTQILNILSLVMYLIQAKSINSVYTGLLLRHNSNILNLELGEAVTFSIFFYSDLGKKQIHKLETEIKMDIDQYNQEKKYFITNERFYSKDVTGIRSKKQIFDFEGCTYEDRNKDNKFISLSKDVSMLNAYLNANLLQPVYYRDQLSYTNINVMSNLTEDIPKQFLEFLDPSIDFLKFERVQQNDSIKILLKFKKSKKVLEMDSPIDLHKILSSGTIKGCGILLNAYRTIQMGGYLIIDELENHFNREIISTLISLFLDKDINKNGGTLIYSTHYVELLDYIDRNDSIYIVRKENGISIEKLSNTNKRRDNNKSYLFTNALLKKTAPSYSATNELKKVFKAQW